VGALFELVKGTTASGLQSKEMAFILEEDYLQQQEIKRADGLDAKSYDGRGARSLFRSLPEPESTCLRLP
jgi:hypothetical protein